MNISFINRALWVTPSNILTIANPNISSINESVTFINFCSLGFRITWSIEKIGNDLFKNLKQQSWIYHSFQLKTFFIPKTKSTFLCISETNVYISNLCLCISIITGMMNSTLMYWPFPAWSLCILDANYGKEFFYDFAFSGFVTLALLLLFLLSILTPILLS